MSFPSELCVFFSQNKSENFRFRTITRVEVPQVITSEQRCFIDLTFFRAESEDIKALALISSDFL